MSIPINKKTKTIFDRIFKRPITFKGLHCKPENNVIPGQEVSIQQIVKDWTLKGTTQHIYHEANIHKFQHMDIIEKIDYVNQIKKDNFHKSLEVKNQLSEINKEKMDALNKASKEKLTQQIREELQQQKRDESNDAKK